MQPGVGIRPPLRRCGWWQSRAQAGPARAHPEQRRWLRSVVQGHLAYSAVPDNTDAVASFRTQVTRHCVKGATAPQPARTRHLATARRRGLAVVLSGVRMPRMNSIMDRWVQTCRHELLDRILIWNQRHLLHALREFEQFYNRHRPPQGIANARPLFPPRRDAARRRPHAVVWTDARVGQRHEDCHRPAVTVWTTAQLTEFLPFVADDPLYRLWWLVGLRGLRRGEVAGDSNPEPMDYGFVPEPTRPRPTARAGLAFIARRRLPMLGRWFGRRWPPPRGQPRPVRYRSPA
jgi:hypothetical protein